jgi:hypothetical protein
LEPDGSLYAYRSPIETPYGPFLLPTNGEFMKPSVLILGASGFIGGHLLRAAELLAVYNARTMVKNRLGRLLSSGQVCMEDGRYRIGKPVLLQMALYVRRLKYLLLRKYSEFE